MLDYWYNKPESKLKLKKARRFISYERKAFQNATILWLFRLIVFTLIFKYDGISECLQLYANYKFLFVLIALVLFLDLSIGFRRVFKINKFQFLYGFLIIISLSFALTLLRPYDGKSMLDFINRGINSKNLLLPSVYLKYGESHNHCTDRIYVTANNEIFIGNEMQVSSENFRYYLNESHRNNFRNTYCLFIDKNTQMKDFNRLKLDMIRADQLKVNIIVENTSKTCQNNPSGIIMGFPPYNQFLFEQDTALFTHRRPPPPSPPINVFIADSNIISIYIGDSYLFFNDSHYELKYIDSLIYEKIAKDKVIKLSYNSFTSFQDYLEVNVAIKNGVYRKRDFLSMKAAGLSFYDLKDEVQYGDSKNEAFKKIYRNIKEDAPILIDDNFLDYLD